jgi:hypothetical protein
MAFEEHGVLADELGEAGLAQRRVVGEPVAMNWAQAE